METKKISREGEVGLKFSDKIMVPDTISQELDGRRRLYIMNYHVNSQTGKRRLIGLSELDVTRDVMDFTFVTNSD